MLLKPVLSVSAMRQSDAQTIDKGTPSRELMRRAGEAIYHSRAWSGPVAIVCGSGNNAGDGYALALLLADAGVACTVFLLSDRFSEDGGYYHGLCRQRGVRILEWSDQERFLGFAEIVDCIFGTGFRGEVGEREARAIAAINQSDCFVVSADLNSGLNGDNGRASLCVHSDLTVAIGYYKPGHFLAQAKDVIASKTCADIGIRAVAPPYLLMQAGDFQEVLLPRKQNTHKGDYGYVALLGGCSSYAGAVKLAGMSCAALRSGCGVATLIVPEELSGSVSPYLLESTLATLPSKNGYALFSPERLDSLLASKRALAIGMGWGSFEDHEKILAHILQNHGLSLCIDADGLNTLAQMDRELLKKTRCRVLLTPHVKEFSRLSGYTVEQILEEPIACAERYASETGVCLLLKGPCTVVSDGAQTLLVDRGCAGMATAGSGDVLAGVLVGLLGYNGVSVQTAACGAYLAGLAGELAEREVGEISMLASDTVSKIPEALRQMILAQNEGST